MSQSRTSSVANSEASSEATPAHGPEIRLQTGCKVNLTLRITGLRPNGYHELDSLFYPLPQPCDVLHIAEGREAGLRISCAVPDIDPQNNTLTRAYTAYGESTGYRPPLHVRLEKGIPHGAGLGGGSADAALLLRFLQDQAPNPLNPAQLTALAANVGADVPFFLQDAPCRVTGIGEILEPLPSFLTGWHIVLLCPPVRVSTPWAYQAWDKYAATVNVQKNVFQDLTSLPLRAKEFVFQRATIANAFEAVVFDAQPLLRVYKESLLQNGANAAVLSGSGASLVGIFEHGAAAQKAASVFKAQGLQVYRVEL